MTYVLVSESKTGIHKPDPSWEEEVLTFSMVFPPNLGEDGNLRPPKGNAVFRQVVKTAKTLTASGGFGGILVGFDFDLSGEVMAAALKAGLIEEGIPEAKIFRTPLTQEGYLFVKEWPDISPYLAYAKMERAFMEIQRKNGIRYPIGFEKALSLKLLSKYAGRSIEIEGAETDPMGGTSLATIVTKSLGRGMTE